MWPRFRFDLLGRRRLQGEALRFGDLALDLRTHEVRRGRRLIDFTPTEFRLAELFLANPGRVLTHAEIFGTVWGFDFGRDSNLLHVYVGYLRRKTEEGGEPRVIHSVRGIGYVLRR